MIKNHVSLILFVLVSITAYAQQPQQAAKEAYVKFTVYRSSGDDRPKQIKLTKELLNLAPYLTPKQVINANYHLGRMFEDIEQPDSALVYYERALAGEPNYEVLNRALGFIYLSKSAVAAKQASEAIAAKDAAANAKAFAVYKQWVLKAIPRFEKYMACDPDDQMLNILTNLYKSVKDTSALATLNERLKGMSGKCISLLDDE